MRQNESVSNLIAKLSALRDGHILAATSYEYVIADLRDHVSNLIDDSLESAVKEAIRDSVPSNLKPTRKIKRNKKESRSRSYNGKHWTQTPEGKKKLARRMKKQWKSGRISKKQKEYVEQT
jgi:hypothetical protein